MSERHEAIPPAESKQEKAITLVYGLRQMDEKFAELEEARIAEAQKAAESRRGRIQDIPAASTSSGRHNITPEKALDVSGIFSESELSQRGLGPNAPTKGTVRKNTPMGAAASNAALGIVITDPDARADYPTVVLETPKNKVNLRRIAIGFVLSIAGVIAFTGGLNCAFGEDKPETQRASGSSTGPEGESNQGSEATGDEQSNGL